MIDADTTCDYGSCRRSAETLLLRIAGEVAEVRPMCGWHLTDAQRGGDATNVLLRRLTVSAGRDSVSLDLIERGRIA